MPWAMGGGAGAIGASWRIGANNIRAMATTILGLALLTPLDNPNHIGHQVKTLPTYDYIIVGGGTAGSVLAARLSEDPSTSVLLLEAGEAGTAYVEWPILTKLAYGRKRYDWGFVNVRDEGYCEGMENKVCKLSRAKMLGGMSAFNRMMYVRGNKHDFNLWASLGNAGWAYEDVLPYFIRAEDNRDPFLRKSPYHGVGGNIKVSPPRYLSDLAPLWIKAAVDAGFAIGDVNGESQSRFMLHQTTTWSTARGYLAPASHRHNLHIVVKAHVTRVIIDPASRRARGVEFFRKKERRVAWARREVIVSGGAFNSPQLLKLSGVGPCHELRKFGISCISDLPGVGENLQSHFGLGGIDFQVENFDEHGPTVKSIFTPKAIASYLKDRAGPLATVMALEGTGFVSTPFNNASYHDSYHHHHHHVDWPDLQLLFFPVQLAVDGGLLRRSTLGLSAKLWLGRYATRSFKQGFRIVPVNLRPRSRGRVLLRSANAFQHPDIYLNLFDEPHDLHVLREGGRLAERLGLSPPFLRVGAKLNSDWNPYCYKHPAGGPDWWDCRARVFPETVYQESSTCAMGPPDDHYAVVDNQLRVYGVKGLRVVDASVMPTITSGDGTAATVMIAERAADLIKAYWHALHHGLDPALYAAEHVLHAHHGHGHHGDGGEHGAHGDREGHEQHGDRGAADDLWNHVERETPADSGVVHDAGRDDVPVTDVDTRGVGSAASHGDALARGNAGGDAGELDDEDDTGAGRMHAGGVRGEFGPAQDFGYYDEGQQGSSARDISEFGDAGSVGDFDDVNGPGSLDDFRDFDDIRKVAAVEEDEYQDTEAYLAADNYRESWGQTESDEYSHHQGVPGDWGEDFEGLISDVKRELKSDVELKPEPGAELDRKLSPAPETNRGPDRIDDNHFPSRRRRLRQGVQNLKVELLKRRNRMMDVDDGGDGRRRRMVSWDSLRVDDEDGASRSSRGRAGVPSLPDQERRGENRFEFGSKYRYHSVHNDTTIETHQFRHAQRGAPMISSEEGTILEDGNSDKRGDDDRGGGDVKEFSRASRARPGAMLTQAGSVERARVFRRMRGRNRTVARRRMNRKLGDQLKSGTMPGVQKSTTITSTTPSSSVVEIVPGSAHVFEARKLAAT